MIGYKSEKGNLPKDVQKRIMAQIIKINELIAQQKELKRKTHSK